MKKKECSSASLSSRVDLVYNFPGIPLKYLESNFFRASLLTSGHLCFFLYKARYEMKTKVIEGNL